MPSVWKRWSDAVETHVEFDKIPEDGDCPMVCRDRMVVEISVENPLQP